MVTRNKVYIVLTVAFSLLFVALGIFVFSSSYLRAWESLGDLMDSFKYYFSYIFDLDTNFDVGVNMPSDVLTFEGYLPGTWEEFKSDWSNYWMLFGSEEIFEDYVKYLGVKLGDISKILVFLLPVFLLAIWLVRMMYDKENTKHNEDTKQLVAYKKFEDNILQKIKDFVGGYAQFF